MSANSNVRKIRVIIVEDQAADAELMIHRLHGAGFEPEWRRVDGRAEFLTALEVVPDVILADYTLPQFSGLEALRLVRARGLELPFIVVSGSIGEEAAVDVIKEGADDYLLKDRLARLGLAVTQVLEKHELRRARRRAEELRRESEEFVRQLAEHVEMVFWLGNPAATRILYVNQAYEKIWGRSCESLYAAPQSWFEAVHPADLGKVREGEGGAPTHAQRDNWYRIVRPDQSIRWIRERAFPVRNAAGEVYRLAGIAEDITEQRNLEEQFRQSQKMEAIGQLAGGVAHDFNNILTVIQGYTQCLIGAESLSPEARLELNEVLIATERATGLTRQLLLFGRRQVMQPKTLDLNEVVTGITRMLGRVIGADVTLRLVRSPRPVLVHADAGMLEQVLLNLAVNARDAMPHGGELVIETCRLKLGEPPAGAPPQARSGDFVSLGVSDTGSGMAPEVMARIFEPFFTTKSPGKGTGLGLATTQNIAAQHEGWLDVRSTVGEGTTFTIFLPASARGVVSPDKEPLAPSLPRGDETILMVEDEAVVREMAAMILRRQGYKVLEAASGLSALSVWQEHADRIDLLITDMVMPDGLTGVDLMERLQGMKPELKVIFVSGYFMETVADRVALEEGVNFLHKPYRPQGLLRIVRERLDGAGRK